MNEVRLEIPGYCQPKQRTFGRSFVTPPETRAYENLVRQYARLAMKGETIVGLQVYPAGMLLEPFVRELAKSLRRSLDDAGADRARF